MQTFQSVQEVVSKNPKKQFSITIGNFDGVHTGHRRVINEVNSHSESLGLEVIVMTFVPHPRTLLDPECTDFLINTYEERRYLLESIGVKYLVEVNFTRDFSTLSPRDFINQFIAVSSQIKKLFLGHDFNFGKDKKGNFDIAQQACKNIEVIQLPEYKSTGVAVSSSIIREKIKQGQMKDVIPLLERPFFIEGMVKKGEGRGKKIGFPTANLKINPYKFIPSNGVYITRTYCEEMTYNSITNVGKNPTFNLSEKINIETHIFDFDRDIYGQNIRVEFYHKLREEIKFASANDLIEQIKSDILKAKNYQF